MCYIICLFGICYTADVLETNLFKSTGIDSLAVERSLAQKTATGRNIELRY